MKSIFQKPTTNMILNDEILKALEAETISKCPLYDIATDISKQ